MELHIWGPAFGLPSIDPECLAALSLFDHVVPQGQWRLVASNDTTVSPDRESSFPWVTYHYTRDLPPSPLPPLHPYLPTYPSPTPDPLSPALSIYAAPTTPSLPPPAYNGHSLVTR